MSNFSCTYCDKWPAKFRVRANPTDNCTETYRWFCATVCLANYESGQPKPQRAPDLFSVTAS